MTQTRFHIPSLDGLRAVSIAIVFVSHAGLTAVPGGFGVTVFFFLSGYLITTLLRREFAITGDISLPKFYWRRAWRIFPPMYAALALGVVVSLIGLTPGTPTVPAVAAQAFHLSNYASLTELTNGIPLGTHVFWSLAVEEHFYLIFPICALFLLRRLSGPAQAAALLGVCGVVLVWRMILVEVFDASVNRTFISTDTRIDAILFGCALALHFNPMLDRGPQLTDRQAIGVAGVSVVVIGVSMVIRDDFYRETIRYSVQSIALAPLFYAAIQRPNALPFRVLNLRPVMFVGVLSYSLYLVHQIVILALINQRPTLGVPEMMVLAGAISLAIAYAFHVVIEKPSTRARKRYAALPERAETSAPASLP
ncbi:MAG: acyltransferase [Actinomycetota bacterium]